MDLPSRPPIGEGLFFGVGATIGALVASVGASVAAVGASVAAVGASVAAVGIVVLVIDGGTLIRLDGAALGCSPPVLQIKWVFKPHFPSLVQSIRFSVDVHSLAP